MGCAQNERQGSEIFITSLYIDVILQCNDILWERHALHYPRAYLLHLWGFCYLASLQNNLCAGSNRYTSSSNLIKCQRQNGSWECQMSGIQNQADKHIFSSVPKCQASLKYKVVGDILEIVCHIFAIFLNVFLDILILVTCWLWEIVTTSHCLSQVLFNEVIVMDQFYAWPMSRATSTKRYLSGLEASKTGPPQTLCEIEMDKEDAP